MFLKARSKKNIETLHEFGIDYLTPSEMKMALDAMSIVQVNNIFILGDFLAGSNKVDCMQI